MKFPRDFTQLKYSPFSAKMLSFKFLKCVLVSCARVAQILIDITIINLCPNNRRAYWYNYTKYGVDIKYEQSLQIQIGGGKFNHFE